VGTVTDTEDLPLEEDRLVEQKPHLDCYG